MQVGSIVQAVVSFGNTQRVWPSVQFPKKGDILTVSGISKHPHPDMVRAGIVCLTFEEINRPGICDKQIDGTVNFLELQLPDDIEVILEGELEFVLTK